MNATRLAVLLVILSATAAPAHPLAELEFDRTIAVRLDAGGATVTYTLKMTDASRVLDGNKFFKDELLKGVTDGRKHGEKYAALKADWVRQSLVVTVDGRPVAFRLDEKKTPNIIPSYETDGQFRIDMHFRADWPPIAGRPRQFTFQDTTPFVDKANHEAVDDVPGRVTLTVDALKKPGDVDVDADEPERYRDKPLAEIPPGKERERRKATATFTLLGDAVPPSPTPAVPEGTANVAPLVDHRPINGNLDPLLNSNLGLVAVLLLAMLFGAGHAFTPGHGKTMVAAYLIGERGTMKHAVVLGLTATLAHTGSVILLAVILFSAYGNVAPASAQAWLSIAGGLFLFLVGFWLFIQRVRGRADHVHLFSGHDHHHHHGPSGHHHHHGPDCDHDHHHHHGPDCDHDHHHAPKELPAGGFGWWRVILLGLGGGIIPCWDAVGLFLVAMGDGKIGLAIPLLIAFSVGLCAVLILLGVAVVYANRRGMTAFKEKRWFQALPVISAVVLLALGGWFLSDGFKALMGSG